MLRNLVALTVLCLFGATTAKADTFLRPEGQGRVIVNAVFTDSPRGFDDSGDVIDIGDYDQDQAYVTAEYGLTEDLTIILAPSYRKVSVENGDDTSGLGYTEVGARYRLAEGTNWLVSAQALVRIPGKGRSDRIAQLGNTSTDIDGRVGAAYFDGPWFASAEGGYRLRSGDLPNEFHADLSTGVNASDQLLLLATLANTISNGSGEGFFDQEYRYSDAYLSAVYQVTDRVSLQAGYTATLYGRNALRQRGPLIGVWLEF